MKHQLKLRMVSFWWLPWNAKAKHQWIKSGKTSLVLDGKFDLWRFSKCFEENMTRFVFTPAFVSHISNKVLRAITTATHQIILTNMSTTFEWHAEHRYSYASCLCDLLCTEEMSVGTQLGPNIDWLISIDWY